MVFGCEASSAVLRSRFSQETLHLLSCVRSCLRLSFYFSKDLFYNLETVSKLKGKIKILQRFRILLKSIEKNCCMQVTIDSVLSFRFIELTIASNLSLPYIIQGHHFILPRSPTRSRLPSSVFFSTGFLFQCRSVLHTGVN